MNRKKKDKKLKKIIKTELDEIKMMIRDMSKKKTCCVSFCGGRDLQLFYCGKCKKSQYICRKDFRGKSKTKHCPVCNTNSILRKWSIPI